MVRAAMGPAGPHLAPGRGVGPHPVARRTVAAGAGHGGEPVQGGRDAAALVPDAGGTTAAVAIPDLLDDQAKAETSQALVPVDSEPASNTDVQTSEQAAETAEQAEATPTIAGLGRIERNKGGGPARKKRERIVVPERSINGGLDFKFETDPYDIDLHNLLTNEEYTDAITKLNDTLRPSRSKTVDTGLLITGPLLVPLAFWGIRHSKLVKKRKLLLAYGIQDFNDSHPTLYMRYNRPGSLNFLSIERRTSDHNANITGVEESWMDREPVV